MKHVQACVSAREDQESSFHLSGGPVNLMQAGLSAREDRQRRIHHCGCPVRLVFACLCAGKPDNVVLTSEEEQ